MTQITSNDFYEIRIQSLLSDGDDRLLTILYLPFIGIEALSLYLTLKRQEPLLPFGDVHSIAQLLSSTDMNLTQLHHGRSRLEAVGLLQTSRFKLQDVWSYRFEVYAPKSFADFFQDPLLSGMLTMAIGEKERQRIEDAHSIIASEANYEDVSASFGEVFHPDLNHHAFSQTTTSALLGRTTSSLRKPFDEVSFQDHLQKLDVNPALFQSQLPLLIDYATLYGLDELALSELLLAPKVSNLMAGTINFEELTRLAILEKRLPFVRQRKQKKIIDSPSDRAAEINQMETLSPFEFLQLKQNGATPSAPDLKLAEELHFSMRLPYPVINALFDYVLRTQENTLPKSLTLKIAASLGRENLQHAIDTLDYFVKVENKGKNYSKTKNTSATPSSQKISSSLNNIDQSEDLEEELKALK